MRYFILAISIGLFVTGCSTKRVISYNDDPKIVFQRILDEEVSNPENGIVGTSLTVITPKFSIDFSGASGFDGLEKNRVLLPQQAFRIASLTKVFVATAILRLQEEGLLSIEDKISNYISEEHSAILRAGGYKPSHITLRHCLTHTSGLYDYAEGGPEYIETASKNASKRWTRTEQIQFAMDNGSPHALPGEENHYSDTGYVLLGEIIENVTQQGLAGGLRALLKFDDLGMSSTYLESLEKRPNGLPPNVKRYMGSIDASDWDNSVDLYGGGGLVANTKDLGVFLQALFNRRIFEKEEILDIMLLKKGFVENSRPLPEKRLGFGSIVGKKSGLEVYLHEGFWGTVFLHIPQYNCSIAINHTNDGDSQVLQRVVDYLAWLNNRNKDSNN